MTSKRERSEARLDHFVAVLDKQLTAAEKLFDDGLYSECETLLLQSLEISRTEFGPHHLNTAIVLNKLGMTYKYLSRYKEAIKSYRTSLVIAEKLLLKKDPFFASLYHNLGGLEHSQGHFALAEVYARESVRIRKKTAAPNSPDLAEDTAALAAILRERGKHGQAKRMLIECLASFRQIAATEPRYYYDVAINANNLAAVYMDLGELEQAEDMYREALQIKERILPALHPDIAITLNNLAMLCSKRKQHDEAQRLQKRCLNILCQSFNKDHPKVVAAMRNAKTIESAASGT